MLEHIDNIQNNVMLCLELYGWYILGVVLALMYMYSKLRPGYIRWRQQMEDAEYHKDPDKMLQRMEEIQRAREKQQRELEAAAVRYAERQKELEERKRREAAERLSKGGSGQKLGSNSADYLPLSGGASSSSYRAPKKKCPGGGCGK